MTLPHLKFVSFRVHKMSQFSTMVFVACAAVMLTLLLVDADSTTECLKDNHAVSLHKNSVPQNVMLLYQ
jgi:hypothetical protein